MICIFKLNHYAIIRGEGEGEGVKGGRAVTRGGRVRKGKRSHSMSTGEEINQMPQSTP